MKLVLYNDDRFGVLDGDEVVDVTKVLRGVRDHPRGQRMNDLITRWEEFKARIQEAATRGQRQLISRVRFRPPLLKPGKIIWLGINYIKEEGAKRLPLDAFVKIPDVVSGDGDTVVLPPLEATTCHPEPELAFVVGKKARHVKAAEAMNHIFGYINFIDFSLRLSRPPDFPTLFAHKGSEGFAPLGPALVTTDELSDPYDREVKLTVNGPVTSYHTGNMGHRLPETVEWLSMICTLNPGDIVSMGTNHQSLQAAMHGDEVSLEIDGLGPPLHIRVKDTLPHRKFERSHPR